MSTTPIVNLPFGSLSPLAGVVLAVAALFVAIVLELGRRRASYAHLPPGPAPHLLTGNAHPVKFPWRAFYALSKTYGPVFTLWRGTTPSVVLNDVASATFLLDKNSRDTSDRPAHFAVVSHGKRTLMTPHNDRWRRMRKALHNRLQPNQAVELRAYQQQSARTVILDILKDPEQFQNHIATYAATLVVHMAYGRTDKARYTDPDIAGIVENGQRIGSMLRPGEYRLDAFPWLKYVPGYMSTINRWNDEELILFREPVDQVRKKMAAGEPLEPCFASYLLENQKEYGLSDDELAYLCGSIFGAGSDTSSAAIQILIMAAATNVEAQKQVQAELDGLVVAGQCPTFEDLELDATPLLHAFLYECFRWRPVSAGGFSHRSVADLVYGDYILPKGTIITANHWGIHRDESYYGPDVENFHMDRWLTEDGQLKKDMKHFQYGFGRRICPGLHVANNSVLINSALLLWSFDIRQKLDAKGKPIPIDTDAFTNTANTHPLKFEATFTPRHEGLADLIRG